MCCIVYFVWNWDLLVIGLCGIHVGVMNELREINCNGPVKIWTLKEINYSGSVQIGKML